MQGVVLRFSASALAPSDAASKEAFFLGGGGVRGGLLLINSECPSMIHKLHHSACGFSTFLWPTKFPAN